MKNLKEKNRIEIIVIEDEVDILELIEYHLTKKGYLVTGFTSTQNVEKFLEEENPSLMIMDRNLPKIEGSQFVSYLRDLGYDIPIIFLTAKDKESDMIDGFNAGGDDYMTKPFSSKELLIRIEALLRRSGAINRNRVKYRDLVLDISQRELTITSKPIELTNLEFKLLYTFIKNPHQALNRDFLRDEVWEDDSADFHDKTVNVAMNRLKKKIDPKGDKEYFAPIWGVGYKLL